MYRLPLLIVVFIAAGVPAAEPTGKSAIAMKKDHLRQRLTILYDGSLKSERLRYDEAAIVDVVKVPELESLFPKTTFFKTTLDTPFFEYPQVNALLCYTATDDDVTIASCLSPVYTTVSPAFLDLFSTAQAASPEQRRQLATGLGKLLAACTERGTVRQLTTQGSVAEFQLWHGNLHWRDIVIRFRDDGVVEAIVVVNPKQ